MTVTIGRRELLAALGGAASLFFCVNAAAQEGYYGAGHVASGLLLSTQKKRWRFVLQFDGL
jgi:hypothetical protein